MIPGNRWDLLADQLPAEPPSVSVIVPHYRQQAQLDRTLAALARQDHPASRLEVIVVDDGSPHAPSVPDGVRLLVQEDRGFRLSAARNLGAAHASGSVLCFLDADTAPEPAYVRELTRLASLCSDAVTVGRRRHADFAGVALGEPIETVGPARELDEPRWLLDGYDSTGNLLDADDRSYRYVIGAVTACSSAFFEEVGGFDESFTSYGGEDWEWAYRAWLAGAVLAHVPAAVAWHDGPEWSAREGSGLAQRNAEALRLSDLIPVPGSRGHGIRPAAADIVVDVPEHWDQALRFVTLDSALAGLPSTAVAASGSDDRARVDVRMCRPARIRGTALRDLVDRLVDERLGSVTVRDDDGPLVRVISRRASAREKRWPGFESFPHVTADGSGIEAIVEEPDVPAYLGGWG